MPHGQSISSPISTSIFSFLNSFASPSYSSKRFRVGLGAWNRAEARTLTIWGLVSLLLNALMNQSPDREKVPPAINSAKVSKKMGEIGVILERLLDCADIKRVDSHHEVIDSRYCARWDREVQVIARGWSAYSTADW